MTTGTLAMPSRPTVERVPPIASHRIAMIALIMSELMLFAGLVGMYLVVRLSAETWPPADQPRLPLAVTTLNTLVLFSSLVPMTRALRAVQRDRAAETARQLLITLGLGALFLTVQGAEWTRLVHHGLTLGSSLYGGTFYVLIGCHALHVLAAVLWLAVVALLAARRRFTATAHAGLETCAIYWYFVSGLWAVLFPLVYLY
jgi:heme/copper-type cytochrome/quinol oxidase subunit 3